MTEKPLIAIKGLKLSLTGPSGPVSILKGIDVDIEAGSSVSLMGPSGSGKTSFMMLLAGLERPTSGSISVSGLDIGSLDENKLARFRREWIGIVFQNFHLMPSMTAEENVALPLEFCGLANVGPRAVAALDAVGLAHRRRHYPAQMSGGEQQRVALARAFVTQPRILLADEPTGNLDEENGRQIMDLMLALHRTLGTTLILITHDQELAKDFGRRLLMKDGLLSAGDGL